MATTETHQTDNYRESAETARDFVCAECGNPLVVVFQNGSYRATCGRNRSHTGVKSHTDVQKDEIRERLNRDPQTSQALAIAGISAPLPSQAVQAMTQEQIANRVRVKFGDMTSVTSQQRAEMIALSVRWGLDPITDLTIYQERVYINYDGRLRKLRDNPMLSPPKVEPLLPDEKEAWGFGREDLVYRCQIWRRGDAQPFEDFGVVRQDEIKKALASDKRPPPVGTHPQLICLKRAIARCSRQATGIDLPTYDPSMREVIVDVTPQESPKPPQRQLEDPAAQARRRFWAIARDELGMNDAEVHATLAVESLKDYPGGYDQALSDLTEKVQLHKEAATAHDSAETSGAAPELERLPF